MKIIVSDKARQDLLRTFSYLAERNPTAAEALLRAIDRRFEQLCRFPFIGRERSSFLSGLRSALVRTYLIFYTVEKDQITIVRVIDGRMDIDEELQK